MPEEIAKAVREHETEMHVFDEDVRTALWGPVKPVTGTRDQKQGVLYQIKQLHDDKRRPLAVIDRVMITALVLAAEVVRQVLT